MTTPKTFASQGDLAAKEISFTEIGPDLYAYTAQGDPEFRESSSATTLPRVDAQATPPWPRT
jgi:hypothetical protein